MVDVAWTIRLYVGSYTWTVNHLDAAAEDQVIDGLTITRSSPDTGLWPEQPDPATLTFGIRTPDIGTYDGLNIGDPVSLLYQVAGVCWERFDGRVADLVASPRAGGAGMILQVTCADYLADLNELLVGVGAWPAESSLARLSRILTSAPGGFTAPTDPDVNNPSVEARAGGSPVTAFAAADALLRQWFVTNSHGSGRYVLKPLLSVDGVTGVGTLVGYGLGVHENTYPERNLPARFGFLPSSLVLSVLVTPGNPFVLDAGLVDLATTWTIRKGDAPNRVQVSGSSGWSVARPSSPPSPTILATLDTDLVNSSDGAAIAAYYLPVPLNGRQWSMDGVTWLAYGDDPGHWPAESTGTALAAPDMIGNLVGIGRIPANTNPSGHTWYIAALDEYQFVMNRGRPRVGLTFRPPNLAVARSSIYTLTFDRVATQVGAATFDQVDPSITFDDLTFIRKD